MRPHQRPRVGHRRDSGLRRIKSNVTPSYPGVEIAAAEQPAETPAEQDAPRLAPALDTGIAVQTRTARAQANAARRQKIAALSVAGTVVVLLTGAVIWRSVSDKAAATTPLVISSSSAAASAPASSGTTLAASLAATVPAPGTNVASETPIFAYYRRVKLHLPIAMKKLTEVGFHQAENPWALPLKTSMKNANLGLAAKNRSTGRDRAAEPSGPKAVMTGLVLRMWRSGRSGRPDTAVDVGALAGTTIMAPVTGTVVNIRPYLLYGQYRDYELHIHPDNTTGLDVVMIHVTDLSCKPGQRVIGGLTPVAKVRRLSQYFHDQLADYTKSPGDHVHVQINDSNYRGYRGLWGAVSPDATSTPKPPKMSKEPTVSDFSEGD